MTNTFNLSKFIKEAMGSDWGVYRTDQTKSGGEYHWWELQDIKNDSNEAWNGWVATNPSLRSVSKECQSFYIKMMREFKRRYQIPETEIKKFFKVYIGYNPSWGAYMCSIGPYCYTGTDPKFTGIDQKNRFSYFTKRFQRADEKTVEASYTNFVNDKLSMFKDIITKDDIQVDFTSANEVNPENGDTKFAHVKIDSLGSNEAQSLMQQAPLQGTGTQYDLNERGERKVLSASVERYGLQNEYNSCVTHVASKYGVQPDQILQFIQTGENPTSVDGSKIIDEISAKLKCFFPFMIQKQADEGGWSEVLNQAIERVAQTSHLSTENVWNVLRSQISVDETTSQAILKPQGLVSKEEDKLRSNFTSLLVKQINKIKDDLQKQSVIKIRTDSDEVKAEKQEKKALAEKVSILPIFNEMGKGRSGQQRPTALDIKTVQKSLLGLKEDILRRIVEHQAANPNQPINVKEIADQMAIGRKTKKTRATANWTEENVQFWIDQISEEMQVPDGQGGFSTRPFSEMLEQTRREITEANDETVKGSFPDFDTAARMASLYFMEANYEEIDPQTRFVITRRYNHPAPLFGREANEPNLTNEQLSQLRVDRSTELRPSAPQEGVANENDIARDIGDAPVAPTTTPAPQAVPSQTPEVVPEESFNVVDQTTTEAPVEEPKEQEQDPNFVPMHAPRLRKILFNTLNSLIKISKELDDEGKLDASEEIHKIIRKYMGT